MQRDIILLFIIWVLQLLFRFSSEQFLWRRDHVRWMMKDYFFNNFLVINSIRLLALDRGRMSVHKLLGLFLYWLLNLSLYFLVLSIILCLALFLFCIRIIVAVFDWWRRTSYGIFNLLKSIFEEPSNFIHCFLGLVWQTFFLLGCTWLLISFLRLNLMLLFEWIIILQLLYLLLVICLLVSLNLILRPRPCIRLFKVSIILNILLYGSIFGNYHLMFPCPLFFLLNFCLHLQRKKLVNELSTSFILFLLAQHRLLFRQIPSTPNRSGCLFFRLPSLLLSTLPLLFTFVTIIVLVYLVRENFGWIVVFLARYFVHFLWRFLLVKLLHRWVG